MPNISSKNEPGAGSEAPRGMTSPDQPGTTEPAGSDAFMSRFLRFSLAKWMGLFALVCALLFARFPEPLIRPWTFANEVGAVYFQDTYNFSFWQAIFTPYAGYYGVLPRLLAQACRWFPYRTLPFWYPLVSLFAAGAVLSFFYWPCFRNVVSRDWQRFVICLGLCAAPAVQPLQRLDEVHFYLVAFLTLVAVMKLPKGRLGKLAVASLSVLSVWSAPVAIVLAPIFFYRAVANAIPRAERLVFGAIAANFVAMVAAVRHLAVPDPINFGAIPSIYWHGFAYRVAALGLVGEGPARRLGRAFGWYGMLPCLLAVVALAVIGLRTERRRGSSMLAPLSFLWLIGATVVLLGLRSDFAADFVRFKPDFPYWFSDRYFLPSTLILFLFLGVLWSRLQGRAREIGSIVGLCWCGYLYLWGYPCYPWTSWGPRFADYCPSIEKAEREAAADGKIHKLYVPIAAQPWFVVLYVGKHKGGGPPQEVVPATLKVTDYFNIDGSAPAGFRHSTWFGLFQDSKYPWLYHDVYGWMTCLEPDKGGFWFWSAEQGYFWTNTVRFPRVLNLQKYAWISLPPKPRH